MDGRTGTKDGERRLSDSGRLNLAFSRGDLGGAFTESGGVITQIITYLVSRFCGISSDMRSISVVDVLYEG